MRKPAIAPLVFSRLFPTPKPSDPPSLQVHITRNLVPEVRSETVCFYGPIDCLEAQYPGLDYANAAHRVRLNRYTWHRKLFKVFDELRLSNYEIQTLCRWEGTRWARERYEQDKGVKIRDTTWDDVELAMHKEPTITRNDYFSEQEVEEGTGDVSEDELPSSGSSLDEEMEDEGEDDQVEAEEGESEDELQQSVGVELNQRLLIATEARARGEEAVLDEDWEQWLKEAADNGVVQEILNTSARSFDELPVDPPGTFGQMVPPIFLSQPEAVDPSTEPPLAPLTPAISALTTTSSTQPTGTTV